MIKRWVIETHKYTGQKTHKENITTPNILWMIKRLVIETHKYMGQKTHKEKITTLNI